jgi:hypothetical protein
VKVKIIATGEIVEHDAGYAVRLIEQGKAVKAEEKEKPKRSGDA